MARPDRRQFLQWSGAATTVLVAGCSGGPNDGQQEETGTDTENSADGPTASPGGTRAEPAETDTESSGKSTTNAPWPQFAYDAANTGDATDRQGPDGDLSVAWEHEVDRFTYAPVVAGDAVVAQLPDGLRAFDAADGTELWSFTPGENGGSPPALAEGTAFVASNAGTLYAVDVADGTERWSADVGGRGLLAAPVVAGGSVIVAPREAPVTAFDPDGDRRWTAKVAGAGFPPASDGERIHCPVVDGEERGLAALSLADGDVDWQSSIDVRQLGPVAVSSDRIVMSAAGSAVGDISGTSRSTGYVGVDAGSGDPQWAVPKGYDLPLAPPLLGGDSAVIPGGDVDEEGDAHAYVVALEDGSARDRHRFDPAPEESGFMYHGATAGDGVTYFSASDTDRTGALTAVDGESGTALGHVSLDVAVASPPVIFDGRVYVAGEGGLVAIETV
ncbi:MAG: PQQ-binding-like beta-propeller repeat protein [Halobacteriales archaeon]